MPTVKDRDKRTGLVYKSWRHEVRMKKALWERYKLECERDNVTPSARTRLLILQFLDSRNNDNNRAENQDEWGRWVERLRAEFRSPQEFMQQLNKMLGCFEKEKWK